MWIKTQDGNLINSDKVYQFYTDDSKVYAQLEAGDRWSDWTLGKYKTAARATAILNAIFAALHTTKKFLKCRRRILRLSIDCGF